MKCADNESQVEDEKKKKKIPVKGEVTHSYFYDRVLAISA